MVIVKCVGSYVPVSNLEEIIDFYFSVCLHCSRGDDCYYDCHDVETHSDSSSRV